MVSQLLPFFIGLTLIPGQLAFSPQECGRFDGVPRALTSVVHKADAAPADTDLYNKAFIMGGLTGNYGSYQQLTDLVTYDISTGVTEHLEPFPKPVSYGAAVFHGDDIYYFGGGVPQEKVYDRHIFKLARVPPVGTDLESYQPQLLRHTLYEARAGASALSYNGYIYIFGGYTQYTVVSNDIIRYNPINGNQTVVAELPEAVAQTSLVVNGNDVYIYGKSEYIYKYNLATNAVTETKSNLTERPPTNPVAVNVMNNLAYILDSNVNSTDNKQIQFDYSTEAIKDVCADGVIPSGIIGSTIFANDNVMIFGGNITNSLRQSVLCISVASMDNACPEENGASTLSLQLATVVLSLLAIKYNISN